MRFNFTSAGCLNYPCRTPRSTQYLKSKTAYARFYLADFVPGADRCVYLDTDLIVLRDLHELQAMDMGGKTLAAVRDVSVRVDVTEQARLTRIEELGARLHLRRPEDYFNSGFLVIDTSRWRASNAETALVRVSTERFDELHSQDQDALNIVFEGDAHLLEPSWNTSQYETDSSFDFGVLHLIGTVKPWHHDYSFHYGQLFYQVLDRTAYAGRRAAPVGSFTARREAFLRMLPTVDMIVGKVRRSFQKSNAVSRLARLGRPATLPMQSVNGSGPEGVSKTVSASTDKMRDGREQVLGAEG